MTDTAKSALDTGCVSDNLQYLCPFYTSPVCPLAALKTKLGFFYTAGRNSIVGQPTLLKTVGQMFVNSIRSMNLWRFPGELIVWSFH